MSMKMLRCECDHTSHFVKERVNSHKYMEVFTDEFIEQIRTNKGTMLVCRDCYRNCPTEKGKNE